MSNLYDFGKKLKELRTQYGYTQSFVAEKLGLTYQSYQCYELGLNFPTLPNCVKLADLFDVSLDYLAGRKEY